MDFPRRLRFKMQSRSLCLWDVNSTHLVFETLRTRLLSSSHSDKQCNVNSMSAYLTSRTLVNCLMLSKELSLNTYSHTSSVAYHRSSACPFKNKNTLSSKQSNKWMGLSGYSFRFQTFKNAIHTSPFSRDKRGFACPLKQNFHRIFTIAFRCSYGMKWVIHWRIQTRSPLAALVFYHFLYVNSISLSEI